MRTANLRRRYLSLLNVLMLQVYVTMQKAYTLSVKSEGVTKVYITIPESTNHLAYRDSVTFNVKLGAVGNESITLQGVGLYPTIVEYNATVVSEIPVEAIYVIDASGKLQKLFRNPEQVIDLSQLRSGYYLVRIVLTNGEAKTVKIVKNSSFLFPFREVDKKSEPLGYYSGGLLYICYVNYYKIMYYE